MTDDSGAHRRRFMQTVAASGGLALAGCIDGTGEDQQRPQDFAQTASPTPTDTDDESADGENADIAEGEYEVGIGVQLDQQAMQELQGEMQELQQQFQAEEINQTEYQEGVADLQEQQQQIVQDGLDSMADDIESETDIEILETYPSMGAIRAAGVPEDLIRTLEFDNVQAIVSPEVFEQQQQQTPAP